MFCQKCGKEISNQAKFCNYCGTPVNDVQPQASPASQAAPQAKPAKKGRAGQTLVTIIVALVVYFVVRGVTENALTNKTRVSSTPQQSQEIIEVKSDVSVAMSSCMYGGLYQNGTLQYGMTKLTAPGYSLLPGEGDERDWLASANGACLIAAYKQNVIMDVSYEASTEAGLLESYKSSYGSAEIIDYRKTMVNGFPVIRYIVAYTDSGIYLYEGGCIVFPGETTKETIRLAMFANIASGASESDINAVLDTLQVSADFALTYEDTQTMGLNRITVK